VSGQPPRLFPELAVYIDEVHAEPSAITDDRRSELEQLVRFIRGHRRRKETAKLLFICTHNSRRSHLAQIWAQTAAHVHGVRGIETYSGGTEATAFNPRAVAALIRAGFAIEATSSGDNPVYAVRFSPAHEPMECFSKVYDRPPNPPQGFGAVMTCSAADHACPAVLGAAERIVIPYDDPKTFDGMERETAAYDERCGQIAREMLFVFGVSASGSTSARVTAR
jgi:hypothetical protein